MIKPVLTYPNKELTEKSEPVDLNSEEFKELCGDLLETVSFFKAHGLAAPQIGVHKRVFVVMIGDDYKIFANPEILDKQDLINYKEGCLSFPGIEELIPRYSDIDIKAFDENGEEVNINLEGLEAVAFQHELDHLDGILFIDRVSKLKQRYMLKKFKKVNKFGTNMYLLQ